MSFALLSTVSVLVGILTLAIALWIAQRLRVQHREVEVLSTIFWQQALEETRARVFVRRFRHWWAWVLLATIAALIWILLAHPQTNSLDGTRHVVLLDWGVADPPTQAADLAAAMTLASSLPTNDREIVAVSTQLETLLVPGEPVELARLRSDTAAGQAPRDLNWAIESLAARATEQSPLALYIVGDSPIDQKRIELLRANLNRDTDADLLTIRRLPTAAAASESMLATLGVADSVDGSWNRVDVWVAVADAEQASSSGDLSVSIGGRPITQPLTRRADGVFELRGLPADGSTLDVTLSAQLVGSITLPQRNAIRVKVEADVPATLRQLITMDPACQIVDADADLKIGSSADADLRLVADDEPAFAITSESEEPDEALAGLVDRLALKQIDATGIAEASGRVVDVQVRSDDHRRIAIWKSLFTPAFDFQESRACPVFVTRSIRWLANRPPLVPWTQLGERLPVSSPEFGRVIERQAATADGRILQSTRLASTPGQPAELSSAPAISFWAGIGPVTWIGLIVSLLLVSEWVLYQRGLIP